MGAMPWIRLDVGLPGHPKILALRDALDGDSFAWTYPVALWMWCARYAPAGIGKGRTGTQITVERACGWKGKAGALFAALVEVGLLDVPEDGAGWAVHDWEDHAGPHRDRFERDRERMRVKREAARAAAGLGELPDDPGAPPGRAWPRRIP